MNNKVKDYIKSLEQTREKIRIEEKIIDIEKQDFEETLMRQREKFYKELEKKEQSVNEKLKEVQSIEDNLNELLEIKIGNFLKSLRGRTNLSNERLEISLETNNLYIIDKGNLILSGSPYEVLQKDNIINKIGLNIPFMIDLSVKLRDYDLITDIETDYDRMIEALWK